MRNNEQDNQIWWVYFRSRIRFLLSRLWRILAFYSVFILFATTILVVWYVFISDGQALPTEMAGVLTMTFSIGAFTAAVGVFAILFILLLLLSISNKGRKMFDNLFNYPEVTELEKIRKRLDRIESQLSGIKRRMSRIGRRR